MNKKEYIPRLYDLKLQGALKSSGAVLIEGAKWCGKTSTAVHASKSQLYMQDPDYAVSHLALADTKPSLLLQGETPRLIDEWQMAPVLWDAVRFEVDLDFNLLKTEQESMVDEKLRQILLKYGSLHDEALKFHGIILVLDYGMGERKLKVEISNRRFADRYEVKNLLGVNMKLMVAADMFAHKLCALLDRPVNVS
ncbi:MAG: hypothetical protein WCR58_10510 [Bacteroidales bacterium]|jgi:hypothetical protein